jgi:hypothetical protein
MRGEYSTIDGTDLPTDYPDIGFFDIDRLVFASQYQSLSACELGHRGLSSEWYARNPSIYTVLMHANQVVGYCNTLPLTTQCFDALMTGRFGDGQIPGTAVCTFHESYAIPVYICGLAIVPSHQTSPHALLALLRGIRVKFQKLRQMGTQVREVGAVAWSHDGQRLATIFGLSQASATCGLGTIYRGKPNKYFGQ